MISDREYLIDVVNTIKTSLPAESICDFIEERRIMPSGAPIPGPVRFKNNPYLCEIQECFSPYSPIEEVAIMKSAQLGMTFIVENVIGYWIAENPTTLLYVSSTGELLDRFSNSKLEPMITSLGLRKNFLAPIDLEENSKTRRSGDKTYLKSFPGGQLALASLNSLASLRSESVRILLIDEIDGYNRTSIEGDPVSVATARTDAYSNQRKICYISTPTTFETSRINKLYEHGDQRHFFIPCPHCGEFIELKLKGLKREDSEVFFYCKKCGSAIEEYQKLGMIAKGEWRATAVSKSPTFRSYHINSLYSRFLSWNKILSEYEIADQEGPDKMRMFINLREGLPYREASEKPQWERLIEQRGMTPEKVVPEFVLFVTCAVDVQTGSTGKKKSEKPRLAVNIVGHGSKKRKAVLFYDEIEGAVDDPERGAWKVFKERLLGGEYTYKRRSDNAEFPVQHCGIDSSDGNIQGTVYDFVASCNTTAIYPIKGKDWIGQRSIANATHYQWAKTDRILKINTTYYKNEVYDGLKVKFDPDAEFQKWGYIEFNKDLPERYFKMLTAEDKVLEGLEFKFINPSGKRNEALDCLAYNLCICDFLIGNEAKQLDTDYSTVLKQWHKALNVPCDLE